MPSHVTSAGLYVVRDSIVRQGLEAGPSLRGEPFAVVDGATFLADGHRPYNFGFGPNSWPATPNDLRERLADEWLSMHIGEQLDLWAAWEGLVEKLSLLHEAWFLADDLLALASEIRLGEDVLAIWG